MTALNGPVGEIEQRMLDCAPAIERWLRSEWLRHVPPFYTSVDIRNAGFKVAPVDTNLYPGGWNNLAPEMLPLAGRAARTMLKRLCPDVRRVLLLPENHTRNAFYLKNVRALRQILDAAGVAHEVGTLSPDIRRPTQVDLGDGQQMTFAPVTRRQGRLVLDTFSPDVILLNNDLSAGLPPALDGLDGQRVTPPLQAGWYVRRKSRHFSAYEAVSRRFAAMLEVDPWLLDSLFDHCEDVDFATASGIDDLQARVDALLMRIRRKYKEYGIEELPFVVIKADNGTYGMGIMMVRDASELNTLNRRVRNKMAVVKDGQRVSSVLIQEGVRTREVIHHAVAEPVVYLIGQQVVGGFYRANATRGADENLNAPGAAFHPMPLQHSGHDAANRFYMYGVMGQLAALAASCELEGQQREAQACLETA